MKRFLSLAISMMLVIMFFLSNAAIAGEKVQLCHSPPGNPDNWHTIIVSENALQAHLSHGDLEGACDDPSNCSTVCDDENPCTVDECDFVNGGCKNTQPVDCDDGRTCTADFCDTSSGCRNIESCEGFEECGYVTGVCVKCPQHIREHITMVIATIIAQKHNYPDSTGYPDLGGRDSMQYLCDRSENWTHFEVKASMQQVLEWWELVPSVYVPMGGGIRAKFLFHITGSDQNTPGEWGWRMFDSNGWYCNTEDCNGRIAESCGIDSPCWDFIHTDEAYVCAKWAEREIRAINGMQCQIDPITPQ